LETAPTAFKDVPVCGFEGACADGEDGDAGGVDGVVIGTEGAAEGAADGEEGSTKVTR
jgi:hypothetical protein